MQRTFSIGVSLLVGGENDFGSQNNDEFDVSRKTINSRAHRTYVNQCLSGRSNNTSFLL